MWVLTQHPDDDDNDGGGGGGDNDDDDDDNVGNKKQQFNLERWKLPNNKNTSQQNYL